VVATSADGTATSQDLTVHDRATRREPHERRHHWDTVALGISCDGGSTLPCSDSVTITAGGRTVASGSYSTGTTARLRVMLNATGQGLLDKHYTLPATVTIGGTTPTSKSITFSYGRTKASIAVSWKAGSKYTTLRRLQISPLPKGATIALTCAGGGCPFKRRSLKAHGSTAKFSSSARYRAGDKLTVEVTAPNSVAEVVVFKMRKHSRRASRSCARRPACERPRPARNAVLTHRGPIAD
jgi:hypothetical protein